MSISRSCSGSIVGTGVLEKGFGPPEEDGLGRLRSRSPIAVHQLKTRSAGKLLLPAAMQVQVEWQAGTSSNRRGGYHDPQIATRQPAGNLRSREVAGSGAAIS